eukprot:scaffold21340_cov179-Amphora_coffeaeformis.AAC.1
MSNNNNNSSSSSSSSNNNNNNSRPTIVSSPLRAHAVRFGPGTDLVPALLETAATCNASCILTAVGSLEYVKLRMASAAAGDPNSLQYKELHERMEIVSLVGTFSGNPAPCNKHLHMVRTYVHICMHGEGTTWRECVSFAIRSGDHSPHLFLPRRLFACDFDMVTTSTTIFE